ncbi:UvrD-helicase domain-containing protein [Mycoplasmopsis felis]|nr:UvrD-helicase domain-containing protein [Mycoplasmopsis felis]
MLEKYKNKYDYILIDEFQDTSVLQYEIMKRNYFR